MHANLLINVVADGTTYTPRGQSWARLAPVHPGTGSALGGRMILAPRYLPRLASTIGLFTNYGLRDFARNQGLLSVQGAELATDGEASAEQDQDKAVAFRKRLVALGPAYVKLGQVLSTRPDLLPAPYIRELEHLQDDVGKMEYAD